ncbi:hypothetical protein [Acidovorax sp. BLS4]|uniref:hypothetical protein n=1 Tax=Acidovorax sp. BLS4 TaxID=3273430 RepID=UPI002942B570|nr:hypothetical protein [Paracidovorax avenae]WOI48201.1 hypothetical protein R1Z03_09520 [Paracidovorax avenae]
MLAQQRLGVEGLALAQQIHIQYKQLAQGFLALQAAKLQLFSQWHLDRDAAIGHAKKCF